MRRSLVPGAGDLLGEREMSTKIPERASAVKERGVPPLEGEARRTFIAAAEQDFVDYSLIGNAAWAVEDDSLVLRIPLGGDS